MSYKKIILMNMNQKLRLKDKILILNSQTLTLTYLGILHIYNNIVIYVPGNSYSLIGFKS
jgi:hypothetical protein